MIARTSIALLVSAALVSSLAVGCGDDSAAGTGGASAGPGASGATTTTGAAPDAASTGTDGTGGAGGEYDPPPGSSTVKWGPKTVEAGVDNTQCVTVRLGNTEQLRVGSIHNVLGGVSHHMIVYKVDNEDEERPEPYDCDPFTDTLNPEAGMPLMITQKHEETLELPEGVAFTLAENQMIRLEMHYVNPGVEAVEMEATSTMIPIAEGKFRDEAGFLFAGSVDVNVPRNQEVTLGPVHVDMPEDLEGKNFFGFTGHVHKWGTNVTVDMTSGDESVPAYDVDNFLWSEPPTQYHDPALVLPAGGGFDLVCHWNNSGDEDVGFGEKADDEMCFFWAYYYPSEGSRVCAHTDQFGGVDACCPGDALCSQIF